MKLTHRILLSLAFVGIVGGGPFAVVAPQSVSAAGNECESSSFLTLPTWYRGLTRDDGSPTKCNIKQIGDGTGTPNPDAYVDLTVFIWKVILNIIDIIVQVVGYAAVGLILFGGVKYLTSAGSADAMAAAKKTITDAVIGLVISLVAVAAVRLIMGLIK